MSRQRFLTVALVVASLFVVASPVTIVWVITNRAHQQTAAIARATERSDLRACRARNQLRDGIVDYVDSLGRARRKSALATVTSPYATPDQKQTAIANLHALDYADRQARNNFAHEPCT